MIKRRIDHDWDAYGHRVCSATADLESENKTKHETTESSQNIQETPALHLGTMLTEAGLFGKERKYGQDMPTISNTCTHIFIYLFPSINPYTIHTYKQTNDDFRIIK